MQNTKHEQLTAAGINVEMALERFMGNEMLLERFLKKFPEDPNFEKLEDAMEKGDRESALQAAHTLKGVCGNLSMESLYAELDLQVKAMRAENWQEAQERMSGIARMVREVCQTLQNI